MSEMHRQRSTWGCWLGCAVYLGTVTGVITLGLYLLGCRLR